MSLAEPEQLLCLCSGYIAEGFDNDGLNCSSVTLGFFSVWELVFRVGGKHFSSDVPSDPRCCRVLFAVSVPMGQGLCSALLSVGNCCLTICLHPI